MCRRVEMEMEKEEADLKERRGKENNDEMQEMKEKKRCVWVNGPVIVGAGPSGLATAACLREQGVASYVILERSGCLASLWKERTYDRLRLHLPKCFCELPLMPFPNSFPTYPTKQQFLQYVDEYARRFDIRPRFNECVLSASFDQLCGLWRVVTSNSDGTVTRYICRWLVVATGENSQPVLPQIPGLPVFPGPVLHSSSYRSGAQYNGKKVLVVGSGNSGMELSLDLFHHRALPSIAVRSPVHVLPKEMFGKSTFGIAMGLMRWFPVWIVDKILLIMSALIIGNTESFGLHRPSVGPIQTKNQSGKTPVMDIGTLSHIKKGNIKVVPGVKRFTTRGAMFVDGREMEFDSVILATGYKNNIPMWLKDWYAFFTEEGVPRKEYGKGKRGLYAVGFTRKGLLGVSADARFVARDIASQMTSTATLSLSVTSSPLHLPTGTRINC